MRTTSPGVEPAPLQLVGLLIALANAWALQYMFAKSMGIEGVPVFAGLLAVHVLLVLVFWSLLLARARLFRLTLGRIVFFIYVAGLGNVLSLGAELLAAPHIPAGLLAIIISVSPVFTLLVTLGLRTEPIDRGRIAGLVLGFGASACILWPEVSTAGASLWWILVAFAAPAGFGVMAVIVWSAWPRDLDSLQVAFGVSLAAALLLLPFAWVEDNVAGFLQIGSAGAMATLGFSATVLAEYWLFMHITRSGGAVFACGADFAAIALGLLWAWLIFGEVPTAWMIAAGALAVASLFLIKRIAAATRPLRAG
jgi:drug/metabolite transporter (DMT)-like permease